MSKETQKTPIQTELGQLRASGQRVAEFIVKLDEYDETKTANILLKPCDRKIHDMIWKNAKGSTERATIQGLKALRIGGDEVEMLIGNDYAMMAAEIGLVNYISPAEVIIKKN